MTSPDSDPIVRAAVLRFAVEGFEAPLRGIGADAGVSAALIMKRFGSKEGLREATDAFVREWIRDVRSDMRADTLAGDASADFLARLATHDEHAALVIYLVHSILEGSDLGRDLIEELVADAGDTPRYKVIDGVGGFFLTMLLRGDDPTDLPTLARRFLAERA
ncbi:TetR family transcriptional regulator [Microbacterium sorbitolivorans]|uniref:TetR family transcriptional regulator n=1 Tax=Microbacterium sorbitolivorans TaxID=1867410 RepID=UPI0016513E59|nr:TetR family transcriptional regulator [Microbacterium sorbitolivorans]GGF47131.1 TetR family transcriptional regulator [Microbacterium sorbitolivorans]